MCFVRTYNYEEKKPRVSVVFWQVWVGLNPDVWKIDYILL